MAIQYNRRTWVDGSTDTPINADNLNNIESGIERLVTEVNTLDTNVRSKANSADDNNGWDPELYPDYWKIIEDNPKKPKKDKNKENKH